MPSVLTVVFVLTFAALAVGVVWAAYATARESRRRLAMLDGVADRIDYASRSRSPWRYPRLEGALDGSPVRIDLIPDTMVRKDVPSMWGQIAWQRPHAGALIVTIDPRAAEYLKECEIHDRPRLPSPAHWPPRTHVCGDAEGAALLRRLDELDLGARPHLKQLAIGDTEIAVTVRCARARRRPRLLLPSNDFTTDAIDPEVIEEGLGLLREAEARLRADG